MQNCDEVYRAHVISIAGDFVILSREKAAQALGLRLNETKTVIRGGRMTFKKNGTCYLGASPSEISVIRLKQKVGALLRPSEKGVWPDVRKRLNALLRG